MPKGEFTYIEVKCVNPSALSFYVTYDPSGAQGGTQFESHFRVRFGEGSEPPGLMILDEAIRRELLSVITAGQAERFARMIDRLCDVADKVDSAPRSMSGLESPPGGVLSFAQDRQPERT